MFDIGFSEIIVISVVALIVIGPERLPKVARTLGHLLGRLQRYVGDVKSDIQREMHVEELKKIQADIQTQASDIERTVVKEMQSVETTVASESQSLADTMRETGQPTSEPYPQSPAAGDTASSLVDFDPGRDVPAQTLPPPPVAAPASAANNAGQPELPGMTAASPAQDKAA